MKAPYKFHVFLLFLLSISYLTKAADLIVAGGQTYRVPKGQTQTFENARISGELIVEAGATLNLTGNLVVELTATRIALDSNSVMDVQITSILNGGILSILKKSKMTTGRFEGRGASSTKLDGNSSLEVKNSQTIFLSTASLEINGGSRFIASGKEFNQGLIIVNAASLKIDNSSKLEIKKGDLYFTSSSPVDIAHGSTLTIGKDLIISQTAVKVTQSAIIELYGNATVFLGTFTFDTNAELRLLGGNQTLKDIPEFYNLVLQGSGTKYLSGTGSWTIKNKLDIGSSLLVVDNTLHISSTQPNAILRTTGYIVSGRIKRSVNAQSLNKSYLFPIGISGKYRPVKITPREATEGSYIVEFKDGKANSLGNKADQVLSINNLFYHKIYKEGNAPKADISIFYNEGEDAFLNRIAGWNSTISKWEFSGAFGGMLVETPYSGITARNITLSVLNNSNPGSTLFVLARAEEKPFIPQTYAVLKKQVDGGVFIAIQDTLRFRFEEEYAVENMNLTYRVYDKNHIPITSISSTLKENAGDNRFKLYVSKVSPGEQALLEVENKKGEKWYLKFKTKEL